MKASFFANPSYSAGLEIYIYKHTHIVIIIYT